MRLCAKVSKCTGMKNLYAHWFTTNCKLYFRLLEGERTRRIYNRMFAKAVEMIWDVSSWIASATFQESCNDHISVYIQRIP